DQRRWLGEVGGGDLGCFWENFVDRAERTSHQHVSAANRERNNQRKTQRKRQQKSPQHRFDLVVWHSDLDQKAGTILCLVRQGVKKEFMSVRHFDFMGMRLRER